MIPAPEEPLAPRLGPVPSERCGERAAVPLNDDLIDQRDKSEDVERCRRDFEKTGNPLYAWEAWGVVRFTWRSELHQSLAVPDWLGKYLDTPLEWANLADHGDSISRL